MQKSPRYHHLDALRGIMMILGIVIHAALTYGTKDHSVHWGIADPLTRHIAFDALADLIHLFRMQVFFVIAGFFAAMLFFERGTKAMLTNRIRRVLFPFLASLVILIPINIWAFKRSIRATRLVTGDDLTNSYTFMSATAGESISMMHLWFLYYLMLLCLIAWIMAKYTIEYQHTKVLWVRAQFKKRLLTGHLFWVGVSATFLSLLWANSTFTLTSLSFIPNPITLYTYAVFFGFGWLLYHHRAYLDIFKIRYKRYLYTGLLLCLVRWSIPFLIKNHAEGIVFHVKMGLAALIMWLLVFGIIGFFIHRFAQPSKRLRYISDASYWIYLTHLPLTAFLPSLLVNYSFGAFFKFLIIVTITITCTLFSYHLLVRNTFVGKFLNGRTYQRLIK